MRSLLIFAAIFSMAAVPSFAQAQRRQTEETTSPSNSMYAKEGQCDIQPYGQDVYRFVCAPGMPVAQHLSAFLHAHPGLEVTSMAETKFRPLGPCVAGICLTPTKPVIGMIVTFRKKS